MKLSKFFLTLGALVTMISCGSDDPETSQPIPPPPTPTGKLVLTASTKAIKDSGMDYCEFTTKQGDVAVTEGVELYMVGVTRPLEAMRFSSTRAGEYKFYAKLKDVQSEEVTVNVVGGVPELPADAQPSNTSFRRRVMALQMTGTTCPNCPKMIAGIRQFMTTADADKALFTAIHGFQPDGKLYSGITAAISQAYGTGSFPALTLNMRRDEIKCTPNPAATTANIATAINAEWKGDAKAGISVAAVRSGGSIVVNIAVKAAVEGSYHVGAWVLEDKIKAAQANSSGLTADDKFGIHNNVVRQVAGRLSDYDFSGEELGTLAAGATATRILQIPVDTKWVMENCKVIVFVSTPDKAQAEKYYVNNAILCNLGAATAFEYK